jgi:hypothetical protein
LQTIDFPGLPPPFPPLVPLGTEIPNLGIPFQIGVKKPITVPTIPKPPPIPKVPKIPTGPFDSVIKPGDFPFANNPFDDITIPTGNTIFP